MPLPTPLLPLSTSPDAAIAGELIVVDSSTVIAGGTMIAAFAAAPRKARRSDSTLVERGAGRSLMGTLLF
jgi:hypothetical protein